MAVLEQRWSLFQISLLLVLILFAATPNRSEKATFEDKLISISRAHRDGVKSINQHTFTASKGIISALSPKHSARPPMDVPVSNMQKHIRKRAILDVDDRTCKSYNDTQDHPYDAMGLLSGGCTAFLFGPRHLLTAGSCLYDPHTKEWITNLAFYRYMSCNDIGEFVQWKTAYVLYDWFAFGLESANLGIIALEDNFTSDSYFGIGYRNVWPSNQDNVTIPGYSEDMFGKYYCQCSSSCSAQECMAYDVNRILPYVLFGWNRAHRLCHNCNTLPYTQGGPVIIGNFESFFNQTADGMNGRNTTSEFYAAGVNTLSTFKHSTAVKFNQERFNLLELVKSSC